jgi:DNA-binding transcriptional ArsR family regulator
VTDDVGPVFAALSDPTRRAVIRHLSESGPGTLSDVARELPVTRQAVAKHLAQLEEAGLVAATEDGRRRR